MLRRCTPYFLPKSIDVSGIMNRNTRALSKALTLVESSNPAHAADIGELLRQLSDKRAAAATATGKSEEEANKPMLRIAISGSPGAGKSCFIEALGMHIAADLDLKVGVIAVDPSSVVTGGSILGDKTRMDKLSVHQNAYIRPSPSRGHLGGVTARSWESMEILEAAQFDVILVETVGVGQSEIAAKDMTDLFLLLVPPASGDELQGIKKGIVEIADAVIVTKDDGDRTMMARTTKQAYTRAVQYRNDCHIQKPVMTVSSEESKESIAKAWDIISDMWLDKYEKGMVEATRKSQKMKHFHAFFEHELLARAWARVGRGEMEHLEDLIVRGRLAPREAAEKALKTVLERGVSE